VAQIFPLKDAAPDVTVGQYRGLLRDLQLRQIADQLQITMPVRLARALEVPRDQPRNLPAGGLQIVLPPPERQVPAARLSFVEVRADDRCFEVDAGNHKTVGSGQWAVGSGQWAIPEYCKLPTAHCLLFLRDRDRLALRRQFELVTPQIEGYAEMHQIIS